MQGKLPGGNGHLSGDLHLNEIVYIGAHNCAMAKCYGWMYVQQNVSITEQFEKYGARHFKIPLHWHVINNVPQIVIAHEEDGESNCKQSVMQRALKTPERAIDRLRELFDLTIKYPQEIIVLKIESKLLSNSKANGTKGWDKGKIATMLHNLLCDTRVNQKAIVFQGQEPPTLGWCRQNNKTILITIEPANSIINELAQYTHDSYHLSAQVDWEVDPLLEVTHGKVRRGMTGASGQIYSPFLEIHLNPEVSFRPDSQYREKYNNFQHVRKRFLGFNFHCKKLPNFLAADCVDQGDLVKIVDQVNDIINSKGKYHPDVFSAW